MNPFLHSLFLFIIPSSFASLLLPLGTREAAFVHSIFSAGIANSITKECSKGKMRKCHCDANLRGFSRAGFQWSGCSDNFRFGVQFSKAFVDGYERETWRNSWSFDRVMMNLHNNEAGRKVVVALYLCHKVLRRGNQRGH